MDKREETYERERLQEITRLIEASIVQWEKRHNRSGKQMEELHKHMWEDLPHLVRSLDDLVELNMFSKQVAQEQRSHENSGRELRELLMMMESPYFGRIDFKDDEDEEILPVYIGKRAFIDPETLDIYIYDWRAPISAMFYDYDVGRGHYNSPTGIRQGDISLKRHYRIRGGKLEAMYDADSLVMDDILGSILSEQAGRNLKVIAASIQKEQNQAIRYVEPRDMLVLGPAGSGKTSVGLHRVAYLLYHNRGRLNSKDVMVISANQAFNSYISNIMPDLYEEDVRRVVFAELIEPLLPEGFTVGTYYDQMEYMLAATEGEARLDWIRAICSREFAEHMRKYLDDISIEPIEIRFKDEVIATRDEFKDFMAIDESGKSYQARLHRMDYFIETRCEEFFTQNEARIRGEVDTQEKDIYTPEEMDAYFKTLSDNCLSRHLSLVRSKNRLDPERLLVLAVENFLKQAGKGTALLEQFRLRLRRRKLFYEDALALLCVQAVMGRIKPMEGVRVALLDEAQDYSALQHFLLRVMFPRCSFMLLADARQAVLPHVSITDSAMFEQLYPKGFNTFRLSKSYRFTGAIGALAAGLIAGRDEITYYDRPGKKPVCIQVSDIAEGVCEILSSKPSAIGTTAVITLTRAAAQDLYVRISGRAKISLVTEQNEEINSDTIILPLYLSKGLEFDRVILAYLDGKQSEHALEDNLLYFMCTRALHELYILHTGALPAPLEANKEHMEIII